MLVKIVKMPDLFKPLRLKKEGNVKIWSYMKNHKKKLQINHGRMVLIYFAKKTRQKFRKFVVNC